MSYVKRIILIDDNESDNLFHSIILKRAGFGDEVLMFENGVDALAFLRTADLSIHTLIFLDINMPLLDGFQVAEQAGPLLAGTPTFTIMMLTSSGNPTDRQRAAGLPVIKGFITKPLTEDTAKELLAAPL
jgi:CheY-like chemotaxis protein